ncbi:hypothetical protein JCM11251_000604 [Rhodosporidiobolus azoricus]
MPSSPLQERTNAPLVSPIALPPSAFSRNCPSAAAAMTTPAKPFRLPLLNAPPPPSPKTASRRSSPSFSRPLPPSTSSSHLIPPFAALAAAEKEMSTSSFAFCVDPQSGRAMVSPVKPRSGGSGSTVIHGGASSWRVASSLMTGSAAGKSGMCDAESPFGKAAPIAASWTARRTSRSAAESKTMARGVLGPNTVDVDLHFELDSENVAGPSKPLLPFSSDPALSTDSASTSTFDPFLPTTFSAAPSAEVEVHTTDDADHNLDQEDLEGRSLLSQWTTASPSPKRDQRRKRARTITLSGPDEGQSLVAEKTKGRPHSNTISLPVKAIPLPPASAPAASTSFSLLTHNLPSPASSLARTHSEMPSSPSRPPPPRRHPSLGTALSSLSLVTEEETIPPPPRPEGAPPIQLQYAPYSVLNNVPAISADQNALAVALASLLSKDRINRLPAGLVPLLEAVVKVGTAHLVGDTATEGTVSRIAALAGLLEGGMGQDEAGGQGGKGDNLKEEQHDDIAVAPLLAPSAGARLQPHMRTASSCSSLSLASTTATSAYSSLSLRSHRSTPSLSATTVTPKHPDPLANQLPSDPVPYKPHPPYPRNFARPLCFVYETGVTSYEEQREERSAFFAGAAAAAEEGRFEEDWVPGRGKRRRSGGGGKVEEGRGGRKKRGKKGREVGWVIEGDEEEDEPAGKERKAKGEEEEDCQYVPRPSRSRSATTTVEADEDRPVPSPKVGADVEEGADQASKVKQGKRGRRGRS